MRPAASSPTYRAAVVAGGEGEEVDAEQRDRLGVVGQLERRPEVLRDAVVACGTDCGENRSLIAENASH